MAVQKITSQLDILSTSNLINSNSGFIGLGAKSDGLYQKINSGSDLKLATTTDLTNYLTLTGGTLTGTLSLQNCLITTGCKIGSYLNDDSNVTLQAGITSGVFGNITVRGNWNGTTNIGGYTTFDTAGLERMRINEVGNVLIGATSDNGYKLQVSGANVGTNTTSISIINTAGNSYALTSGIYGVSEQGFSIKNITNSTIPFAISSSGNVLFGISTDNSRGILQINGGFSQSSSGNFTIDAPGVAGGRLTVDSTGNLSVGGDVTAFQTSDLKLKKNINKLNNSLEIINKLNPVSYNWNKKAKELNPSKTDKKDVGVIAQELETILPNLVHNMYNDENIKGVDYIKIIPYLIGAIKELTTEINKLKNNK